jgi:Protein of unknown function (DUF732)
MRLPLALAGAVVVIGLAAPAHADANQDQAFLDAVKAAGLSYETADKAIAAGKNVCEMAKAGKPAAEIVKSLQDQNPGLTQETAAKFTAISTVAYCPDQKKPSGGS